MPNVKILLLTHHLRLSECEERVHPSAGPVGLRSVDGRVRRRRSGRRGVHAVGTEHRSEL